MNAPHTGTTALTGTISLKTILVAVDLSPHSETTARYAVDIAKFFGASIVLVHVHVPIEVNEFVTEGSFEAMSRQRRHAQELLTGLADTVRESHPACQEAFLIGDPAEEIARLAHERDADLIITSSHHPGLLARLLYLDQAPRIMHAAPCPVLVYHEGYRGMLSSPSSSPAAQVAGSEGETIRKKILLPVDLAAEPGPTVAFGVKLARQWDADLYVLHVYSAPPYATSPHYVYAVQGIDWQRRQLEGKLLDWVSQLQKQHPRTFALFEDSESPAREIQRVAGNLHADLIVVSTHDRAWLSKYLFYSDADEIARRATSPVLVFRVKQEPERSGREG
jgi:nucleotide-binding universal stress UspA family protein